jgi:hypothetical protein
MDECCKNTSGAMATALGCDAAVLEEVCKAADIDVANYNNPGQIVISGEKEKVKTAVAELKGRGYRKVIELQVAGAFHSRLMAPAGQALAGVLAAVRDYAVAVSKPCLFGDDVYCLEDLCHVHAVFGANCVGRRNVCARDNEDMHGCLGIDIRKGKAVFVLVYHRGGNFSRNYFTENAVHIENS